MCVIDALFATIDAIAQFSLDFDGIGDRQTAE